MNTVRVGQVWSMTSGIGTGRIRFRILSVDGDHVVSELLCRTPRQRVLSARSISRGARGSRLEVDENGQEVVVQPRDAALLEMRERGLGVKEMAKELGLSVGHIRRMIGAAKQRERIAEGQR